MRVIECIEKRRSTRAYSERAVEKEKLEQIVRCGVLAPTGRNKQALRFVVLQDEQEKQVFLNYCRACLEAGGNRRIMGPMPSSLSLRTWNRQPHRCRMRPQPWKTCFWRRQSWNWAHAGSILRLCSILRRCREKSISGCGDSRPLRMPGVLCDRLCRTGCSAERKTREYRQIYLMGASFPDASAY